MTRACVALLICTGLNFADSLSTVTADSLPFVFSAGDTARAEDVTGNLVFILGRVKAHEMKTDSLVSLSLSVARLQDSIDAVRAVDSLTIDSLKTAYAEVAADAAALRTALDDSIAAVKSVSSRLPVGTVVASLLTPSKFYELVGTDSVSWSLADGTTSTTEYFNATGAANIPDLRGVFLRGLNEGRADGKQDPEGDARMPGSFQSDTLKSHTHVEGLTFGYEGVYSGGSYGGLNKPTSATGGAETRPRNAAVYWYVKVR